MTTNSIWSRSSGLMQDTNSRGALISAFVEKSKVEAFTASHDMTLKTSILAVADAVVAFLKDIGTLSVIKSDESKWLAVEASSVLVLISDEDRRTDAPSYDYEYDNENEEGGSLLVPRIGVFGVTAVGSRDILYLVMNHIKGKFQNERFARIKWWYDDGGRATYKTTYIDNPNTVLRPEFYPGLGDPEKYITEYLKADASILLMAGAPGTGKTTMLRHMIYKHNLTASVVYDETLMQKDTVFQSFLFDKKDDILIIEDADAILSSRDLDKNKLMSRFLNVSDGLIKLPSKKLVFTTNLTDFNKVDEALMRPGRCFDVLHTRALHSKEAIVAARAADLPIPLEDREYTVAELFNPTANKPSVRRIGFR